MLKLPPSTNNQQKSSLPAKSRIVIVVCTLIGICVMVYSSSVQIHPFIHMMKTNVDGRAQQFRNVVKVIADDILQSSRNIVNVTRNLTIQSLVRSVKPVEERLDSSPTPLLNRCRSRNHTCSAPDEKEGFDDRLNMSIPTWDELEKRYSHILRGGRSKPDHPSHKIVIIIPYRDRRVHLKIFLNHMHPFLQRQNLEYVIYVIEMGPGHLFRRAAVSNAGFLEVMKREETPCVIFHDVDMLPTNDRNLYYCTDTVRHYAVALQQYNYKLFYQSYFGGIVAFPPKLFTEINGYSNLYLSWGGEDDDLFIRVVNSHIPWTRQPAKLGNYTCLQHDRLPEFINRQELVLKAAERMKKDGLNSLNYTVDAIEERPLFTWILVNITRVVDTFTNIKPIFRPHNKV